MFTVRLKNLLMGVLLLSVSMTSMAESSQTAEGSQLAEGSLMAEGSELAAFKKAIRAKYNMKEAAFAANDPEPILNQFYTDDAVSTGPDGVTHVGRESLREVYEQVIGGSVRIESYKTVVNGGAGWDWVNFHVNPNVEGEAPFTFKLLFLWENINGEWWSQGEAYVIGEFEIDKR